MEVEKHTFEENGILGAASAVVGKTLACPIERPRLLISRMDTDYIIKNRLTNPKLYNDYFRELTLFGRTIRLERNKVPFNVYRHVITQEGILAFWRGNVRNVLNYFPAQGFNFGFYGLYKNQFKSESTIGTNMMSGGLAGISSLALLYPLAMARIELAYNLKLNKKGADRYINGLSDAFSQLYQKEGVRGMYKGFGISAAGTFVYRSLYFGLFDSILNHSELARNHLFISFPLAWMVSFTAAVASYPVDTIRRRIMTKQIPFTKSNIIESVREGNLFKGVELGIHRAIGGALVLTLYSQFQQYFYFDAK